MSVNYAVPSASLYIHVPFCAQKCAYCAFYSEASTGETVNRYVTALVRELELVADDVKPSTVFFGGGTPSLLNLRQWGQILGTLDRLKLLGAEEWTIECNPATVSSDKAKLWRDHGVNRVSLGVQSLSESLLDRLGRLHDRSMVFKSFDLLRCAGFDNINLDLMFAIPGQALSVWRATLHEAIALGSEHLSCYEVIYEEDTPLFAQLQAGQFKVDEDLACAMYDELLERAAQNGFEQYEIANFARSQSRTTAVAGQAGILPVPEPQLGQTNAQLPVERASAERVPARRDACPAVTDFPARACRHNINYWRGGSYYGLGPSAATYVGGVRMKNWSNTNLYCEWLEQGRRAVEWREHLPPLRRAGETAAFGLRMNAGWTFRQFQQTTGFDLRQDWRHEIDHSLQRGWAVLGEERFHLTQEGLRFADAVAEEFLR